MEIWNSMNGLHIFSLILSFLILLIKVNYMIYSLFIGTLDVQDIHAL
jgi:hypothetical protein